MFTIQQSWPIFILVKSTKQNDQSLSLVLTISCHTKYSQKMKPLDTTKERRKKEIFSLNKGGK